MQCGILSNSPWKPLVAFSFPTLEAYRCLRNRKPSLSIQAFTKALCDIHLEPWAPVNSRQFSEAFDVYLEILRRVDSMVKTALKQDSPDYRLLHSCPPCQYKLADEPPLVYSHLMSLDGNSSLKRFASCAATNAPTFTSDYYLSNDAVNVYADEVVKRGKRKKGKSKKKKKKKKAPVTDEDVVMEIGEEAGMAAAGVEEEEEDVVVKAGQIDAATSSSLDQVVSVCVERWKANADEAKKGMFDCYDEAGIFISICRHGIILIVCDMIRSGEL